MKRVLLLLLLLLLQPAAWAQLPAAASTPDASPSAAASPALSPALSASPLPREAAAPERAKAAENPADQQLRDLRTRMQSAMNSQDLAALLAGVTDDVVFTTMNGDVVRGKDGMGAYFDKMMKGPDALVKSVSTNFEADGLTVLYGGSLGDPEDAGVAWGHSDDTYVLRDGSKFTLHPRWTATVIREPDGWKVASFHYSVSMFDNPVLDKVKRSMGLVGGAGLGLGLALGLLIGYVVGRRRK
jgi:ketosteroid isomerase-like protein